MARSALRSVGDAIDATRSFLVPPSLRRIASLALIALFMGTPGTPLPANPQFADPYYWRTWQQPTPDGEDADAALEGVELADPGAWPTWLLAAVGIGIALALAYFLVGTLMRFVLVEALRRDEVELRHDARRHLRGAIGVLVLRLLVWGVALGVAAVAAASVAGLDAAPVALDRTGAILAGGAVTGVVALAWTVELLTLQFVVPTMVADGRGVVSAWRRFLPTLRAEPVEYVLYGVVRVLVGIAVGLAAAVGVVVALALAGVVLGTVAAIVVVLAGGVGSLGTVSLSVLGLLVAIFVLVGLVAAAVVAVPFQIYLWIYALLVLGDVDPTLDLIPDLRASVRDDEPAVV